MSLRLGCVLAAVTARAGTAASLFLAQQFIDEGCNATPDLCDRGLELLARTRHIPLLDLFRVGVRHSTQVTSK